MFVSSFIMFEAFQQSDFVGKAIVIGLLLFSVYSWAVMLWKFADLRGIKDFNRIFVEAYRESVHPLSLYAGEKRLSKGSPTVEIYLDSAKELMEILNRRGISEINVREWMKGQKDSLLGDLDIASVRSIAERKLAEKQISVERGMSKIATAVNAAPSIGLFGTVWGVMTAFMAMAQNGNAMISAVAPGISAALLTTVVGLIVAIPAAIGYNMLSDRIRETVVEMENFVDELMSDIASIHGTGKVA